MPPVNFNDASEPEEPPPSSNLVSGASFSRRSHYASRPRARSESLRAFTHSPPPPPIHADDLTRPRLLRTMSPKSDSRRKLFAHARSHSSPTLFEGAGPRIRSESNSQTTSSRKGSHLALPSVVMEIGTEEEKQQDQADDPTKQDGAVSGGSHATDDDETDTGFDFDSPLSADAARSSHANTDAQQRYLCGRALPLWCTSRPNANRVTAFIAKHAPCFWCRQSLSLTTTNQAILLRLSSLCGFLGLCQAGSASFLLIVLLSDTLVDRNAEHVDRGDTGGSGTVLSLWNINTFVVFAGLLGALIFLIMLLARRAFSELDLTGSLRFLWCMMWIIPLEIYCTIGMFDAHGVGEVWIRHWWTTRVLAWFRSKACRRGTYNTRCVVPIDGLPLFKSERAWCMYYYKSEACGPIRNRAQFKVTTYSYTFFNANGALGVVTVFMLVLSVNFLEGIITRPIVQKSRESNIPLWLFLPIVGCFITGSITLFSKSSILQRNAGTENVWPGVMYLVAGCLFTIAAILGYFISHYRVLNTRDKRVKMFSIALFITTLMLTLLIVATIFVQSILLSSNVVGIPLDDNLRGELACTIAEESCSFCHNDINKCPEWTDDDVKTVLQTQLKSSAALAAIFMIYSLGALRFGFVLYRHIRRYQIDYV